MSASARRLLMAANVGAAPAFDPETSIAWHSLFWAEGSTFSALGLANNDPVSTWSNETGESNATQATGSKKPLYKTSVVGFNGNPGVKFDGSDDFLSTGAFSSNPSYPVSIVLVMSNWTVDKSLFDGITSSNRNTIYESGDDWAIYAGSTVLSGTNIDANTKAVVFKVSTSGNDVLYVNGTELANGAAGSQTLTGLILGNNYTTTATSFGGELAMVGIYEGDLLADDNYEAFMSYLEDHYGITIA